MKYVDQGYKQFTTLRNPYKIATSWCRNESGGSRFGFDNWEEQWVLWHKAVTEHNFEVIVIENFHEQIYGYQPNRPKVKIPLDKVQFAMNLIQHSGVKHPKYGANS